jgi:hypothetical protein
MQRRAAGPEADRVTLFRQRLGLSTSRMGQQTKENLVSFPSGVCNVNGELVKVRRSR